MALCKNGMQISEGFHIKKQNSGLYTSTTDLDSGKKKYPHKGRKLVFN